MPVPKSNSVEEKSKINTGKSGMTLYIIIGVSCALAVLGCIGVVYACVVKRK